ncbi:SNF2 family N-terminal domain-containing protein [Dipodascopsis uninucleata]
MVQLTPVVSTHIAKSVVNSLVRSTLTTPETTKSSTDENSVIHRSDDDGRDEKYYQTLWRKLKNTKNKTWDGDGILTLSETNCTLHDLSGKFLGKIKCSLKHISAGECVRIGIYETEVENELAREEVLSSRVSLSQEASQVVQQNISKSMNINNTNTKQATSAFKSPFMEKEIDLKMIKTQEPKPRHKINTPEALVMSRVNASPGQEIVDVVVDPVLTQHLRPHQRDGVRFLYDCVMGLNGVPGNGAILADEMGLGKTLITISLIWTLLKQNPIWGQQPVAKKVLIVCPVSLISNWRREFRKWLGRERIAVFVVDQKANLRDFTKGRVYQVMIIGYEKLRLVLDDLKDVPLDLVVCDEGHRIKNTNKSAAALRSLKTPRRILLTGTPIQNDLGEFFAMIDFVCPALFDSYNAFKRQFELPILRSRQPEARKKDVELGRMRSAELSKLTKTFVLRRTAVLLAKYLPPKHEFVVFCKPTKAQLRISRNLLDSTAMQSLIRSSDTSNHLRAITALKKVCNGPSLLLNSKEVCTKLYQSVDLTFLTEMDPSVTRTSKSGKMNFLESFLRRLHDETDEKVVLVSSYTQTLDLIQVILSGLHQTFLRLDGSTPMNKRQQIVDSFNMEDRNTSFAFLLSAKSGGTGINLIGASRLVLFDTDWNPSVDLQAMARIHRDGQKRTVFIYRLLTTGCIDEKIYQRQLTKQGLADSLMDGKSTSTENSFTHEELRDIFTLHDETNCHTHDLLECKCDGCGTPHVNDSDSEESTEESEGSEDDIGWVSATQLLQGKQVLVSCSHLSQLSFDMLTFARII